ncbi:2-keto-3-deoxy-L-rhamnonate aldolase [Deltaproteobacteria bacterium]|nr:2-keto-3-deoxy-L-rhamnonate aldolase [Deltaproteobacteria bacterium]
MKNAAKERMLKGEKLIGAFSVLGSEIAVESLGLGNLDYIIIDTEHGPFSDESAQNYIRAARVRKLSPFVRIKEISRSAVLRMLDAGADGLIVPGIQCVDEVKRLVEYGKFHPLGQRGFGIVRASGYGREDFAQNIDSYFALANAETMIVPQCETVGCLEHIEEICKIAGVDGIFIGPFDLSVSMGIPARFDAPEFRAALQRVIAACKENKKFCFLFALDAAAARQAFALGVDAVTVSTDAGLLIQAVRQLAADIKQ